MLKKVYILYFCLKALRGIKVLVRAINKIQLMPSQLTSIHSDLCQVGNRLSAVEYIASVFCDIVLIYCCCKV